MRYIDADNLHNAKFQDISGYGENVAYRVGWNDAIDAICENEPSIDIVFCKECKYEDDCEQEVLLSEMYGEIEDTAHITYCSYGERREP